MRFLLKTFLNPQNIIVIPTLIVYPLILPSSKVQANCTEENHHKPTPTLIVYSHLKSHLTNQPN